MAKVHQSSKGFKVIRTETIAEALKLGGIAICDSCNNASYTGYYVAVLNNWLCDECYEDWHLRAKYYSEDADYENMLFTQYANIFGLEV